MAIYCFSLVIEADSEEQALEIAEDTGMSIRDMDLQEVSPDEIEEIIEPDIT